MHLRILRARLGRVLEDPVEPSPFQTVRRAQLMLESDRDVDPVLLMEAVSAAMHLLNPDLAIRIARSAVLYGSGRPAQTLYAITTTVGAHPEESARLLRELAATATDGAERAYIALLLAVTLTWNLGRPLESERELDAAEADAAACGLTNGYKAVRASFRAAAGDPVSAEAMANEALSAGGLDGASTMLASLGLVGAYSDLGRLTDLARVAEQAYALSRTSPDTAHVRFVVGMLHVIGLRLAGALDEARAVAVDLRRQSQDVGVSIALTGLSMGLVEISCGDLTSAQTWFRECLATGEAIAASENMHRFAGQWLATVLAMAGEREAVQEPLELALAAPFPENLMWEPDLILAQAWAESVRGSATRAAQLATQAAKRARSQNRPAAEVMCLQTATQFGDPTTAERLEQLSRIVAGPRAAAAAANTVALRNCAAPEQLTARQREVVALAAVGASNAEIADQLVMSTRTVEGHILKAVQRTGVGSRAELIALFNGR